MRKSPNFAQTQRTEGAIRKWHWIRRGVIASTVLCRTLFDAAVSFVKKLRPDPSYMLIAATRPRHSTME